MIRYANITYVKGKPMYAELPEGHLLIENRSEDIPPGLKGGVFDYDPEDTMILASFITQDVLQTLLEKI